MATYRVKAGCVHGAYGQHAAGALVDLTEWEAGAFLDKLQLVSEGADAVGLVSLSEQANEVGLVSQSEASEGASLDTVSSEIRPVKRRKGKQG